MHMLAVRLQFLDHRESFRGVHTCQLAAGVL